MCQRRRRIDPPVPIELDPPSDNRWVNFGRRIDRADVVLTHPYVH
jgi:hypothetical protein